MDFSTLFLLTFKPCCCYNWEEMLKNLFRKSQTSILSAAFVIAAMVATSRVLGLVRDRLLTARFTTDELGIYFAAFRIPNFVFEIMAMGAVSVAFIPVFTSYIYKGKKEEAYRVASSVINLGVIISFIFSLVLFVFADQISKFITPGFKGEELTLMISFTRIMILFQVLPLIVGSFLTGILQSFKQFLIPAIAPVVYNVGIIIGIVFLTPVLHLYAPVVGVVIGAFLFFVIQVPFVLLLNYRHSFKIDIKEKGVREIGKLMLPRTIGMAASQIDSTVDLILASLLSTRSVSVFYLAQHLQLLPVGLFAISIAQAALPNLSEESMKENLVTFKKSFLTSLHQIFFLIFPFSVLFIVLRIPIVRLVFGADRFDWPSTVLTGKTLAYFSISLFAQGAIQLLSRSFFALHDSKTPVMAAILSIVINVVLSVVFIVFLNLPVYALALSTSIASILNALALLILLDIKVFHFDKFALLKPFVKIVFASMVTAFSTYIPLKLLDQLIFDTTRTFELILLTGTVSTFGLAIYLFMAWFLNIEEVAVFLNFAKKVVKVKDLFLEPSKETGVGEISS